MRFSRPPRFDEPPRRVVSLLPSATEIVAALGIADRLVGITHECDYPPEVLTLPRLTANLVATPPVGSPASSGQIDADVRSALAAGDGLYALDEALLGALGPDLVLTQELCSVCAVAYPVVLDAARLAGGDEGPLVVSLEPRRLTDVLDTIRLVADVCGVRERGDEVVSELEGRLTKIGVHAAAADARRPRVAVLEWLDPLFAPGHWVPDQVDAAGGVSVFGEPGARSREVEWPALARADPEIVVLGLCGFDLPRTLDEWREFDPPAALRATAAWRAGQVWAIDGSAYVSRPGPRLVDGAEILAEIARGEVTERAVRLAVGAAFSLGASSRKPPT